MKTFKGNNLPLYRWITFASLLVLVLMACNLPAFVQRQLAPPTATTEPSIAPLVEAVPPSDPLASDQACLVGDWQVSGLNQYVVAAIPPDLAQEYDLQYQDTTGSAYFSLSPDGHFALTADQLELVFNARVSFLRVPVMVGFDGQALGSYTVEGDTLTITGMDTRGLQASARAMGNNLMEPAQIINAIPFMRPPHNVARYACTGDRLQLKLLSYPDRLPPLVFNRAP
jgi:hypothetical protein